MSQQINKKIVKKMGDKGRYDSQNQLIEKIVQSSSKTYGLILFYRGGSSIS